MLRNLAPNSLEESENNFAKMEEELLSYKTFFCGEVSIQKIILQGSLSKTFSLNITDSFICKWNKELKKIFKKRTVWRSGMKFLKFRIY